MNIFASTTARRGGGMVASFLTRTNALKRTAPRHSSTFAVAFDIDGVLYRGSQDITPAKAVILDLQQRNVPILFLTNGGGLTESDKVQRLGERLGIPTLTADQMLLSHTPMKQLNELKDKLVLAVGKDNAKPILQS
jgi:ribonucleotide monophosphatase NagD (HAD superfamily)|tara:strand:+ start:76 stop:483 length:408 start_codon:yes stop_codon:yes gene_type:complete